MPQHMYTNSHTGIPLYTSVLVCNPPSFSSPVVISHGTQRKERRLTKSSYHWPILAFCVTLVCESLYFSTVLSHGTQGKCSVSSDVHWPMTFINMPAAMQYPPFLPLPSSAPEISTLGVLNIINQGAPTRRSRDIPLPPACTISNPNGSRPH